MKRFLLSLAAVVATMAAQAQNAKADREDSLRLYHLQEIEVTATRATQTTPVAYTNLSEEAIAKNNLGLDIPYLLQMTPSMVATSETGIGIGNTGIRLRGTDGTRLNVTANGVPLNNPDSHTTYWYDTPDFISAVGTVQIQRGAGISTNGTGAFGGAINMTTASLPTQFEGDASLSYGSYNTNKQAVHIGSGLMGGHWIVDARLTHIGSDGYIDRGATDLKSYMFQGGYYNSSTMVKLLSFGGKAKTYLTYNGSTKEEMRLNGRRYNSSGMFLTSDSPHKVYNSEAGEWQRVGYYEDQTDNYLQINNQLLISHRFSPKWALNFTGHYTYGYGYYKQYKDDGKLIEHGFTPEDAFDPEGNKLRHDLIREKLMRNHFGGANASAHYTADKLEMAFGASWSYYACPHWGELDWVQDSPKGFKKGMRWYENDVDKQDANLFARVNWSLAKGLRFYADMQYRYVSYKAWGVNDNYDGNIDGMQKIDVDKQYHFFNPRAGLSYTHGGHNLYFSFAVAQKEPTRSDFTDRFSEEQPSAERLLDYELGYQFSNPRFSAGVNFYYMKYKDQLVHTGMVNDSSDALNINVPQSYRRGVELSASWRVASWFTLGANATLSQNKIEDYVDRLYESPTFGQNLGRMTISYSPDAIAAALFDFHYKGFEAVFHTQYVGKQYFSNNENETLSLDSYCVTNLNLAYTLRTKTCRSIRFGVALYNLFDTEYESNGFGYSYMWDGKRTDMSYYFPQAPLNVLANIAVRF